MLDQGSETTPPPKTANGVSEDFECTAFGRKTLREYLEQAFQYSSAGNPDPDFAVRRIANILDQSQTTASCEFRGTVLSLLGAEQSRNTSSCIFLEKSKSNTRPLTFSIGCGLNWNVYHPWPATPDPDGPLPESLANAHISKSVSPCNRNGPWINPGSPHSDDARTIVVTSLFTLTEHTGSFLL